MYVNLIINLWYLQWLLQKPKVTVFMGSVGRDKFSDILKSKAEADGVDTHYQYNESTPTG